MSAMISLEHAFIDREYGHLWDELPDLSDLEIMSAFLALERLKGPDSEWGPFLAVLPETFDTPLYFSPAELDALEGSSVHLASQRTKSRERERERERESRGWIGAMMTQILK